jgi:ribosomal protein L11 methylase PrmA
MAILDLGCGYGTFSIASARIVAKRGPDYAFDIDENMIRKVTT